MDIPGNIDTFGHLLKVGVLQSDARSADRNVEGACPLVDISDFFLLSFLSRHPPSISEPEFVVEGTSDQASLVQEDGSGIVALGLLEIQILSPVGQLRVVKLGNVEIRPFDFRLVSPSLWWSPFECGLKISRWKLSILVRTSRSISSSPFGAAWKPAFSASTSARN